MDTRPGSPKDPSRLLDALEITEQECRQCGTLIAGLNGRYACALCGWVNDHSEGHSPLPRAEDDPDAGRNKRPRSTRR